MKSALDWYQSRYTIRCYSKLETEGGDCEENARWILFTVDGTHNRECSGMDWIWNNR